MVNSEDETVEGEDPTEALRRKVQMYELAQSKIQEYTKMLSVANEDEKKYLNEQIDIWKQYANGLNPKDDGTEKLTSGLEQVRHHITIGTVIRLIQCFCTHDFPVFRINGEPNLIIPP